MSNGIYCINYIEYIKGRRANLDNMLLKVLKKLVIAFIVIILAVSFILNSSILLKYKIEWSVRHNLNYLNECIENGTYDKIYRIKGIRNITPYTLNDKELYIDFYCYGFGFVPGSIYYGFYYSSNDEPVGFQAVPVKLEPQGDGWKWKQIGGDNVYYTEKIAKNWYYYKAGF
jgi:hypothetical protein